MKTTTLARPATVERKWWLIDAKNEVLGRMAVHIAMRLMGKHKPTYTPHVDTGDFIVVTNAGMVKVTGRKKEQRMLRHHTQRPSGLKETLLGDMLDSRPERAIRLAVRRMLPKNRLGRAMIKKLKIYNTTEHPHSAQKPEPLALGTGR